MPDYLAADRNIDNDPDYLLRYANSMFRMPAACSATLLSFSLCIGCTSEDTPAGRPSVDQDWVTLFDGSSLDHWTGLGRDAVPEAHWRIEDGALRKVASGDVPVAPDGQPLEGGDIMTVDTFRDFEIEFEWKVAAGANSGVKYNVSEELSTAHEPRNAALGFEYQILDDHVHADGAIASHRTAGLYDMIAPDEDKPMRPVGEWNHASIVFIGNHGEHWLNGERVVEFDLDTPRFDSLLTASKYATIDGFAEKRDGHIVLQDHGDDVWFRNIRIRRITEPQ